MKILLLTSIYPFKNEERSKKTKVASYFAKEWAKMGHQVVVVVNTTIFPSFYYKIADKIKFGDSSISEVLEAPEKKERIRNRKFEYNENGIHIINIPILKIYPHGNFSQNRLKKHFFEIISILSKMNFVPDLVTGHWVNPQIILIPPIAKKYGAISSFVFHNDYGKWNCRKFKIQRYIDEIDHVGFRSTFAATEAKKYLNFKREPFIAPSGIPNEYIKEYESVPLKSFVKNKLKIISAARLVKYKNIDKIIYAVEKIVPFISIELIIAGDGPLKMRYQKILSKSNILNDVHLIGQISRDELQKKMKECDIFILISKRETFGLVYLEAMLNGCLVIASRFGGVDGIIIDGENGFLCDEGNSNELVQIIKKINELPLDKKKEISLNAYFTAIHYSDKLVAERYLDSIFKY